MVSTSVTTRLRAGVLVQVDSLELSEKVPRYVEGQCSIQHIFKADCQTQTKISVGAGVKTWFFICKTWLFIQTTWFFICKTWLFTQTTNVFICTTVFICIYNLIFYMHNLFLLHVHFILYFHRLLILCIKLDFFYVNPLSCFYSILMSHKADVW